MSLPVECSRDNTPGLSTYVTYISISPANSWIVEWIVVI